MDAPKVRQVGRYQNCLLPFAIDAIRTHLVPPAVQNSSQSRSACPAQAESAATPTVPAGSYAHPVPAPKCAPLLTNVTPPQPARPIAPPSPAPASNPQSSTSLRSSAQSHSPI